MSENTEPLSAKEIEALDDCDAFIYDSADRCNAIRQRLLATVSDRDIKLAEVTRELAEAFADVKLLERTGKFLPPADPDPVEDALFAELAVVKRSLTTETAALAASEAAREKAGKALNLLKKASQEEPHFVKLEHGSNCQLRTIGAIDGRLEKKCTCWKDEFDKAEAAREKAEKALANIAGDNLCWIDSALVKIPPKAEFLKSCRRYHEQISRERGELSGCMTIAQLESSLATSEAARLVAEEQRDGLEYHFKAAIHNCDVEIANVKELYDRLDSAELTLAGAREAMRKAQQYVDHKPDSSPYEVCRDWCPACAIEKGLAALPAPSPLELAIREWAGMRTAWLKTGKPELAERQAAADTLYALIPDAWKKPVISTEPAK